MRRPLTVLLTTALAATVLTACGDDREACMRDYKAQQLTLTGATPTDAQAREACDRDRNRVRGGGSGVGK